MLRRVLLVLLALALLPLQTGFTESVENALHVAIHGHSAHSSEGGDRDAHHDIEHGCAGNVHTCPCCGHLFVAPVESTGFPIVAPVLVAPRIWLAQTTGPAGSKLSIFRPPIG